MPSVETYTVGWICAVAKEYVAARSFLDEEHDSLQTLSMEDNNTYTLGKMAGHNIVMAVLPDGEYGVSSAAGVARDMMHTFPHIRIGLMVGIGGGVPSENHDIRLGDIVVSSPRKGRGGVISYDFGKMIQGQGFHRAAILNRPPPILRTAVTSIIGHHESEGHNLSESIDNALKENPRLQQKYGRPDPDSDRLYQPQVVHPVQLDLSCELACGTETFKLIQRHERLGNVSVPVIHYGNIASGSSLMKDALERDKIAAQEDILCFEMEAAGLMNHFPCIVIRGICDYADSHKNDLWQGYAAMAAAAYAKDLLRRIIPRSFGAETKIPEAIVEKQKCHQLLRLTSLDRDVTYEWYKDRVVNRLEGTCLWFLGHTHFQSWLKQKHGPLLVTADPGCGKSVLAKYLIDRVLPQSTASAICYFFFKDQDQNTICQALCAILHQLFSQKPFLLEHAVEQFRENGNGFIYSKRSLWTILQNSANDPQAGDIVFVLDALDECHELEFNDLMQHLQEKSSNYQSRHWGVRYLLTCRPYEQIVSKFRGLLEFSPLIHIPGEDESETISQEVNHVIKHRVSRLSRMKRLSTPVRSYLEKRLQATTNRTYLWVHLIFEYLEGETFKKTTKGIEATISSLPSTINDAYEQILDKSQEKSLVRKALCIVLAARRPLTLPEMNVALNTENTLEGIHDIDLERKEVFKERLRSLCGLFLSIYQGQIHFLHQTAREFLLADPLIPITIQSNSHWSQSIALQEAHYVLLENCVLYLNLFNSDIPVSRAANEDILMKKRQKKKSITMKLQMKKPRMKRPIMTTLQKKKLKAAILTATLSWSIQLGPGARIF